MNNRREKDLEAAKQKHEAEIARLRAIQDRDRREIAELVAKLADSAAENERLRARLEAMVDEVAKVRATIDRVVAANERLAAKLEPLVGEVGRLRAQVAAASGTAAETPSGQIPPYRKPNRETRAKKPGQKKGHPGKTRRAPPEPDREEVHKLDRCPRCDSPVKLIRDAAMGPVCRVRYVEDIVMGSSEVAQHSCQQYWCRRCKSRVEPAVTAALPGSRLGLQVVVWSAVQHFAYGLPTAKIVAILRNDYGFVVTPGGLHAAWHQLAGFLHFAYQSIIDKVKKAGVLHADETGWRVNGVSAWLWCFATKKEVGYLIDRHRTSSVVIDVLGREFEGTLVQDFYAAYNACRAALTQYCLAHLLREFKKIEIRDNGGSVAFRRFRKTVTRIIRDAIGFHIACPDPPAREAARIRFERRLLKVMEEPSRDKDVLRLTKRLWRSSHGIFTFLTTPDVDPTNNHAERQIRAAVVMRKISGGSRSHRGAETRAILMSLFRTQSLQGVESVAATLELTKARIVELHRLKGRRAASDG